MTEERLITPAMSRRHFLAAFPAAAMASPAAATQAPKSRLIAAIEEDPTFINSAISALPTSFTLSAPVYSSLTRRRANNVVEPDLAERWDISPDGRLYTFHLRRGVRWHDGHPFTAEDVKFTLENATMTVHPRGRTAYKAVERVETPDDHTVRLHLSTPSAALMAATDMAVMVVLPRHLWQDADLMTNPLNRRPVGTGPYRFADYVRGERVRYVRNEGYFGQRPAFDELIYQIVPDAATRMAMFQRGDLDVLSWNVLPQSHAKRLAALPDIAVRRTDNGGAAYLGIINVRRPQLSDPAIRRAMFHAIDRAFIRANVDQGATSAPIVGSVAPSSPLYKADLPDYPFDVARANALLDAAGAKRGADGMRFTFDVLWPAADLACAKVAEIMQANLRRVGIGVILSPLDRPTMNQRAYAENDFGMTIEAVILGPDPDIGTERFYNSNNIRPLPYSNNSGYVNPALDRLFDAQRAQVDLAARKEIYGRIQEMLWRDLPIFPFFSFLPNNAFRTDHVTGVFNQSNGSYENFADVERVTAPAADKQTSLAALGLGGAALLAAVGAGAWRARTSDEEED